MDIYPLHIVKVQMIWYLFVFLCFVLFCCFDGVKWDDGLYMWQFISLSNLNLNFFWIVLIVWRNCFAILFACYIIFIIWKYDCHGRFLVWSKFPQFGTVHTTGTQEIFHGWVNIRWFWSPLITYYNNSSSHPCLSH